MEDLAIFSVREESSSRGKRKSIALQKNSESQSKRQSHPSKLSEN